MNQQSRTGGLPRSRLCWPEIYPDRSPKASEDLAEHSKALRQGTRVTYFSSWRGAVA